MYDRVLVPTDGSDHALRAAEHANALATAFDATVHVVAVVDVQTAAGPFDAGGVSEAFVTRLEEQGEEAVQAVRATLGRNDVRTATLRGEPVETILAYADDHEVDLVAMGTAGRTGLSQHLLGSTTERLIRHAAMPVLAVNARDRAGD